MSRVLIAGAAGFLGSHLADRLLQDGHDVVGLDNLATGRLSNLEDACRSRAFRFVEADVADLPGLGESFDEIYDLASPASPKDYLQRPFETMRAGAIGTIDLLTLARADDARFLLTSTSEVYGDAQVSPQPESYWGNVNPIGPRAVYDEAKRFAEAATMAAHRYWTVDTRIARIFNTYGPRMRPDDGRVVSTFVRQAIAGQPLTVFGDGTQTRSFCYVDDLVDGLVRLMARGDASPHNLGNPHEIAILDLADHVRTAIGVDVPITFMPLPEDDPKRRRPDITRAQDRLGWTPRTALEDGIRRLADHYRAREATRPVAEVVG